MSSLIAQIEGEKYAGFHASPVLDNDGNIIGLRFLQEADLEDYRGVLGLLRQHGTVYKWLLADTINEGAQRWGDMYGDVCDEYDINYFTAAKYALVARMFPPETRDLRLSFTHYMHVADKRLTSGERLEILDAAIEHGLTTRNVLAMKNEFLARLELGSGDGDGDDDDGKKTPKMQTRRSVTISGTYRSRDDFIAELLGKLPQGGFYVQLGDIVWWEA